MEEQGAEVRARPREEQPAGAGQGEPGGGGRPGRPHALARAPRAAPQPLQPREAAAAQRRGGEGQGDERHGHRGPPPRAG